LPAPQALLDLVARYQAQREAYASGKYNETQLRREFLDPFFEALGWDVANRQGFAEPYKDVIHEDQVKVGGLTKAPDYSFRVGGMRKFFVEAKKPAVNIKADSNPAYQLRRYAWSAKLPLSILTDFEELAVYDCRIRPSPGDKASLGRILYFRFDEFEARWDELAAIFSREAVLKGSFDRFVESKKGKRGTAEVDDAFLEDIERWRDLLARNLALRNPDLSQRELNFAVQRTIDRIVFLRICEDRGLEHPERLRALVNGTGVYPRLVELFREADARYNSGLFHFRGEKGRDEAPDDLTPGLELDDKVLKEVITGLYYPESPYEFSVLPADILGQVYEQFLGKVIRLTAGHRAVVEEKPEVKKAGGVYYTPTYIVDYIVRQTVGKLLEGRTPKQADRLTVLDPACGSGSFLIGAYQFLLDWYRDRYVYDGPEKHRKRLYPGPGGAWRLVAAERKRILLNSIYGVDIDPQAVEVTKLSLLLKVLEGETSEALQHELSAFRTRALPDLGRNIKCGNSLIGPDFYDGKQLDVFTEEERLRINAFDWKAEFAQIFRREDGGFDSVIGNPPYVRIQRIPHDESDYLFSRYRTLVSKADISLAFIERSLALLHSQGRGALICTSQWIRTDYGKYLRDVLRDGTLQELIDFGSLPVFPGLSTYPAILVLSPSKGAHLNYRRVSSRASLGSASGIAAVPAQALPLSRLTQQRWLLEGFDLLAQLDARGVRWNPLRAIAPAAVGLLTGMDEAFVLPRINAEAAGLEGELLLPYAYRGAEIEAYSQIAPEAVVIYPYRPLGNGTPALIPDSELRARFPKVYRHLSHFKERLRQRRDSRRLYAEGLHWHRHLRPGTYGYIDPAKLVVKGVNAALCSGQLRSRSAFNGANCPGVVLTESVDEERRLVLLALLNSRVLTYFLFQVAPPKLGQYLRFNANSLNQLPIASATQRQLTEIALKCAEMTTLQEEAATAHVNSVRTRLQPARRAALEASIYELYHLTDAEIRLIEEATAQVPEDE
jgi:hypothetical protein